MIMKVRKIAKRKPPVRPFFARIVHFRSARFAKFFRVTPEETRKAWMFFIK